MFGFHAVVLGENISIDVLSITNVGLILTKLGWFLHFGTSQNSILTFFGKKIEFLGFHAVALLKNLAIDVSTSNYYCRTDNGEARVTSFLEVQTDRRTDRQTRFRNPHLETCRHTKTFNSKLKIKS